MRRLIRPGAVRQASMNLAATVCLVGGGLFFLRDPVIALMLSSRSAIRRQVVTIADSTEDVEGHRTALLPRDSSTFLIFLDASCEGCRLDARAYVSFARWAAIQGVATRLLLSNDRQSAEQFGRLSGDVHAVRITSDDFYERLGITAFPSFVLVDHHGVSHARWLGAGIPDHLQALNAITTNGK